MGSKQHRKTNARIRERLRQGDFRNRNGKGMELLTKQLLKDLPRREDINENGPIVYAKLFNPIGSWTWWVLAFNPESRLLYCVVQGEYLEAGDVPIDDLIRVEQMGALGIERSLSFNYKPLSQCVDVSKMGEPV